MGREPYKTVTPDHQRSNLITNSDAEHDAIYDPISISE
ncbi:hypothetical protein CCACVL1_04804 [Corchorus capsularis]|uniref:Uncharacterized protein n=1 Tax=Corchorus capsularis TaxID=210143 RepID=A0A1R3JPF0_COCAP|nr:hypothetical protein CCACVL1_04804 [Corchorus capsularis]